MNTDEIRVLENLNAAASKQPMPQINICKSFWTQIQNEDKVIEIDSFRYIAVACAAAAIIALFFSADIISTIQNTAAWEVSDQIANIF